MAADVQVLRNLTSELPDALRFFSIFYPPPGFPGFPPGSGGSFCSSSTQPGANRCATIPEPEPFGDGYPQPFGNAAQICNGVIVPADTYFAMTQEEADALAFFAACNPETDLFDNTAQTCTIECEGEPRSFTVPAGVFVGLDQVSADLTAFLFACAVLNLYCSEFPDEEFPEAPTAPNTRQSCTVPCGAGTYTYTVPYNTYRADNQAAANAVARTAACNLASTTRTCFTDIQATACEGESYASVITLVGPEAGNEFDVSVVSGALPPGIEISGGVLIGSPTATGTYNFVLRALFLDGQTLVQPFQIVVSGITGALDNGTVGDPYSEILTAIGFTSPTFSVVAGVLPDGLSLNPNTGEISGTPTASGVFDFIVEATG